jgi:hypothetical protein
MIIDSKNPRPASVISFFLASRGIVSILTGPLFGLLLNTSTPSTKDYGRVINVCGTLLLISSSGVGMRLFYRSSPVDSPEEEPVETHTTATDHHAKTEELRNRKEGAYEMERL